MRLQSKIFLFLFVFIVYEAFAQSSFSINASNQGDLSLDTTDVVIEDAPAEQGVYLHIRKKSGISSILATESAELADNSVATYSLRTYGYHPENGDQKRILNGEFITAETGEGYFIIDSTASANKYFEEAFVLFLPYTMQFGYFDTRKGVIDLNNGGAYISLRTFEKPYADYTGAYRDNSFFIQKIVELNETDVVTQEPIVVTQQIPEIEEKIEVNMKLYSNSTVDSFTSIADKSRTRERFTTGGDDINSAIQKVLSKIPAEKSLEIVIVLDTTRSMSDDIEYIKSGFISMLRNEVADQKSFRIGMVEYRDVNENFLTKKHEFTADLNSVETRISTISPAGGGDWPEEVFTGLSVALNKFNWEAEEKLILLVGDAPAHDPPKSSVKIQDVYDKADALNVEIHPFIIPKP